ncbi:MAG: hypothetical protein IKJ69_05055 [Clostridia bacterium]|nr:hypothetical protein [Clostridia bacterium]
MCKNKFFRVLCSILTFGMLLLTTSCGQRSEKNPNDEDIDLSVSTNNYGTIVVSPQKSNYYELIDSTLNENKDTFRRKINVSADPVTLAYNNDEYFHSSCKALVDFKNCFGFPFAAWCSVNSVDPFAALNELIEAGFVKREAGTSDGVAFAFTTGGHPYQYLNALKENVKPQSFVFSLEGCTEFIEALINLSSLNEGTCKFLPDTETYNVNNLVQQAKNGTYYCDIIVYDTSYSYIFTIEMDSSDSKHIDSVSFKSGMFVYPIYDCSAGIGMSISFVEDSFDFETISLLSSIELLFTGKTCIYDLDEPIDHNDQTYTLCNEYRIKDYQSSLSKDCFKISQIENIDPVSTEITNSFTQYSYEIHKEK